jgi:superfamily I DNA/RNA helicase
MEVLKEIANVASMYFKAPMTRRRHENGCTRKDWECNCPVVMEQDRDYSHARFYGEKAIEAARDWRGIEYQSREKNRGGYPTVQARGALDLYTFVNRVAMYKGDAAQALKLIIDECVRPWLQAEEGLTDEDLAENGKSEDFDLLLHMVRQGQTLEKYLDEVEGLGASDKGVVGDAVEIGTIHWSKGAQHPNVVVNTTRMPIVPPKQREGQLPTGGAASIEEERRLCYVGVTRAQDYCMVVGSAEWNNNVMDVSPFICEMGLRESEVMVA